MLGITVHEPGTGAPIARLNWPAPTRWSGLNVSA